MARISFPTFDEWCDTVLHPEDTHPWNFRTEEFYNEYRGKYALAKMVCPSSVLEVGVRFGYSAWSFLRAWPTISYTGLDMDEPSWGSYKGIPREWAYNKLVKDYPFSTIRTLCVNTQKEEIPSSVKAHTIVHIDGDHSYQGAFHDISCFWPLCSDVMIVDDYGQIPEVQRAVKRFVDEHFDVILLDTSSLRGSAILVRD